MLRIGVTGGIGSGKSTACNVFASLGVPVYDSDANAKRLMIKDQELVSSIIELLGEEAYLDGELNRKYIADKIFSDKELLRKMNATVHPVVTRDFEAWVERLKIDGHPYVIQENAILFEGGFDKGMDYVVAITAPLEQRVGRTALRDGVDEDRVRQRIANQMSDEEKRRRADFVIDNADGADMLMQILGVDEKLSKYGTGKL